MGPGNHKRLHLPGAALQYYWRVVQTPLVDLLNNPGTLSSSSRPQIQVLPPSAVCLCYVHSVALAAIAGWDFDGNIKQCFRLELYPERLIPPSVPSCF